MKCPFKKITKSSTRCLSTNNVEYNEHEEDFAVCDKDNCMAYNVGTYTLCFDGRKSEDMILR